MSKKALVVEDDSSIVSLLQEPLQELGYVAESVRDGASALELFSQGEYQLILLDLNLPKIEGSDVCRHIRQSDKRVPIIVLTGNTDELNTALLLELGADDYVNKPFRKLELKARIKAVERRIHSSTEETEKLIFDGLLIDVAERRVERDGEEIELSAREFDLLLTLASNPGRPFTRDALNSALFGYESGIYDHSISCHINRIRSKLEPDPKNPRYLMTKRGFGYYFNRE